MLELSSPEHVVCFHRYHVLLICLKSIPLGLNNVSEHLRGLKTMHGCLEAVESVLSGWRTTQKKQLSFVLGTTGTGTVSTVDTVYSVVGFPNTTDAPSPIYNTYPKEEASK